METSNKLEEFSNELEATLLELQATDKWRQAVKAAAQLPKRSVSNAILIYEQHVKAYRQGLTDTPEPTLVYGYYDWQKHGRQVKRGEHGYKVIQPVTGKFLQKEDGSLIRVKGNQAQETPEKLETRVVGWKIGYVFDVSQTEGDPIDIPELPAPQPLTGQAPEGLLEGLTSLASQEGYQVKLEADREIDDIDPAAKGLTLTRGDTKQVCVRAGTSAETAMILAHELGHILLGHPGSHDTISRGIREVEAESFAAYIGYTYGIEPWPASTPYIAGWATEQSTDPNKIVETVKNTLKKVATKSSYAINHINNGSSPTPTPSTVWTAPPQKPILADSELANQFLTNPEETRYYDPPTP